ncbi:amino acid permease [Neobacillus mesonae]|uniref:amino acid permease n=1 Tax=Neobacillus mesonae TaxID=1193713 RepID=UPI00203EDEAF|nr:amino acid permease [Neobacillus mesonae]MCM3570388.1 amino acid permease [Neobacillus mesonae]
MKDKSSKHSKLDRSLKDRHIQFLALGGVIGVGLFYGASEAVRLAGPGVLVAYVIAGIIVAIVMRSLGEMTVERPIAGSFSSYAHQLMGPRMGFITGGMWWFFWVATVMSELAAIGKLIQFWYPNFPAWIPGLAALVLFTLSNLLVVKVFGEIEFIFAILKVMTIIGFMIFGALMILTGVFNDGKVVGLTNLWAHDGFLPFGWVGVISVISLVIQGYSGIETLAVEAGESQDPAKSLPKAFKTVTFRISFFYIGSILIMLAAYPWDELLKAGESPYILIFMKAGIPLVATAMNLLIIFSALSSCNTGVYGASRILYSMAEDKNMPAALTKINKNKIPYMATYATAGAMSIGTLITYLSPDYVYIWITSASAFASLFTWIVILVLEIMFRSRMEKSGVKLQYAMPFWPLLPILGIVMLLGAFAAIIYSPLTRVSVFSGIGWLVILIIYYQIKIAPRNKNKEKKKVVNEVHQGI